MLTSVDWFEARWHGVVGRLGVFHQIWWVEGRWGLGTGGIERKVYVL